MHRSSGSVCSCRRLHLAGVFCRADGERLKNRLYPLATLIIGDMRDLALDEPAALVYCPFRALLHLPTWADRRRTFERVAASLRPGGRFAWNAYAFDHRIAARLDGERQTRPAPHTIRYSVGDNRVDLVCDNGAVSSLWWATKNEWLGLIDVAGLELEALYGSFAREPFTPDASEYVFVARRGRQAESVRA